MSLLLQFHQIISQILSSFCNIYRNSAIKDSLYHFNVVEQRKFPTSQPFLYFPSIHHFYTFTVQCYVSSTYCSREIYRFGLLGENPRGLPHIRTCIFQTIPVLEWVGSGINRKRDWISNKGEKQAGGMTYGCEAFLYLSLGNRALLRTMFPVKKSARYVWK